MTGRELAVVQGWEDTRRTLRAWNRAPWSVLGTWVGVSAGIAGLLLFAVVVIGQAVQTDTVPRFLHGLQTPPSLRDVAEVFGRNLLVLALHSMAWLAGFIAMSSLPGNGVGR